MGTNFASHKFSLSQIGQKSQNTFFITKQELIDIDLFDESVLSNYGNNDFVMEQSIIGKFGNLNFTFTFDNESTYNILIRIIIELLLEDGTTELWGDFPLKGSNYELVRIGRTVIPNIGTNIKPDTLMSKTPEELNTKIIRIKINGYIETGETFSYYWNQNNWNNDLITDPNLITTFGNITLVNLNLLWTDTERLTNDTKLSIWYKLR